MKAFLNRALSVTLAGGLWLAGNAWIAGGMSTPASAQESQRYKICSTDSTQKVKITSTCNPTSETTCSGGCKGAIETTSSCQPSDPRNGSTNCGQNGSGSLQNYVSDCVPVKYVTPLPTCECGDFFKTGNPMAVPGDGCAYYAKGNVETGPNPAKGLQEVTRHLPQLALAQDVPAVGRMLTGKSGYRHTGLFYATRGV